MGKREWVWLTMKYRYLILIAFCVGLPGFCEACACGCGIFDVGTSALLPQRSGTSLFLRYAYLDQTENWSGTSAAPDSDNADRHIRTLYATAGLQHLFNRRWGLRLELPYDRRHFATFEDGGGGLRRVDRGQVGDIRISGVYTGFSDDMSSGVLFGVKLANGDYRAPGFDRDTQLGSGSVDMLLGAYRQMHLGGQDSRWSGFERVQLQVPFSTSGGYRPGSEVNAALGAYPLAWRNDAGIALTPTLQALFSYRRSDGGRAGDAENTGYFRILASPGMELGYRRWRLALDVEVPLYQNVRGNQLVAPWQANLTISVHI